MKWSGASALVVLAAAIWGLSFSFIKITVQTVDPLSLLTLRFSLAAFLLAGFFFSTDRRVAVSCIPKGIGLGLTLFLAIGVQTVGLQYTTATNSAFITALSVVWVPLLIAGWYRRIPPANLLFAVGVSVAGLFLLTRPELAFNVGDALTAICAVFFAVHIIFTSKFAQKEETLSLVFVQLATAAALGWLGIVFTGKIMVPQAPEAMVGVLYLGIFGNIVGYSLQTRAQKIIEATRAGILLTTEPLFAAAFGFLLLQETLGILEALGAFLILGGVWLAEFGNGKKR